MPSLMSCKGLHTNHNELGVPEGALVRADNVNIDQNDTISPRRGFKAYGDDFPSSSDRAKQLMIYKDRVLRHYGTSIQYDSDGAGTFSLFSGSYSELETGLRLKYFELNSNFYFTTDDGIKKISATSASDFVTTSGFITSSGMPKGLDIQASLDYTASGFLTADQQVGYRVVWGYTDANNNLLLGAPSERVTIANPASTAIDSFTEIGGTGVYTVVSTAHGLETSDVITISGGSVGNFDGNETITYVDADTFTITNPTGSGTETAVWSYTTQVSLTFTIPTECNTTSYFYQVYRTGLSGAAATDAGDEMNLVYEENLTSTDISNGYVTLADENYPESFRESAAPLYTNEVSGDGILQSNDRAPVAKDVAVFRESAFYANTKTLQRLTLTLTSIDSFAAGTTKIVIGNDSDGTVYNCEATETVASKNFKLFTTGSASQNIRDTAKSLIHVINRDANRLVNAYYSSGSEDLPGIIVFEGTSLDDTYIDFGITGTIGDSFNPTLSQAFIINSITDAAAPVVTTSVAHGFSNGDTVYLYSDLTTPALNGNYTVANKTSDTFTIVETVTVAQAAPGGHTFKQQVYTDNEVAPNRLYFSKTSQPEAVPATNWIDIGGKDAEIIRILPLRDNLFVLKEDGAYIVSGSTAPDFSQRVLDNSVTFKSAGTAVILNNQIFTLANQGVVTISDGGVTVISRQIEDLILSVTTSSFTNYDIYSFGIAYERDRAYHLWLPTKTSDTYATQCYRYNIFNRTWTRWDKNATCGVINPSNEKLYLGVGSDEHILEERKDNLRSDYSDLEFSTNISQDAVNSTTIQLDSATNAEVGDAIVQTQYVSNVRFNRLLRKLDLDQGLTDVDYYSTLAMSTGDSPYTAVSNLMTKLTADDSGKTYTYTSPTTFSALNTLYNTIISDLNDNASDTSYKNYESLSTSVTYDAVITEKATSGNIITVSIALPFQQGEIVIHKGYKKLITWAPQHFGDPSIWKQVREGSIFFDGNTFTNAKVSFASDFSQSFEDINFNSIGPGTFGSSSFGSVPFGGNGTDRGFRTLIPRQKQRCRYISSRFTHLNAREKFIIVGISFGLRPYSSKGYRSV